MRKITFAALILLTSFFAHAEERGAKISVGGMAITSSDIEDRASLILISSGMPNTPKTKEIARERAKDVLIDERLIAQDAEAKNIEYTEEEVTDQIKAIADRNNMSVEQFYKFLEKNKINKTDMYEQVKNQVIWGKIVQNHVTPFITVTDGEIQESRSGIEQAIAEESEVSEMKIAEIALYVNTQKQAERKFEEAQKIYTQLQKGSNFGKIAREFSESSSAAQEGLIGWLRSDQINPNLARVLTKLKVGDTTKPLPLPDGIHIFKLLEKKIISSDARKPTDAEIKQMLLDRKNENAIKSYLRKLRNDAHIHYKDQ